MSDKDSSEDIERTIRLNANKVMDPYDNPTPPSVDSIEDLFNSDDFSNTSDASFELPDEAIVSSPENVDFDDLTKEMNQLSDEFDLNALEEVSDNVPAPVKEDKPIEKKVTEKVSSAPTNETAPETMPVTAIEDEPAEKKNAEKISSTNQTTSKASAAKNQQDHISKPEIDSTDKKEIKKEKEPAPIPIAKKAVANTNKPSNGISVAMLFISLIALAAGFTGAWTSMSLQSQIDKLSTQLSAAENTRLDNQAKLITMQAELSSLKQTLADLKLQHETPALIKSEPAKVVKPAKKLSPATITPTTPIKEVKPTLLKNTWNVIISSHDSIKKAKSEQQRESIKSMNTSIVPVVVKGKNWYRIVATGFTDKQQAVNFAQKLKQQGISDAWVQYNK